MERTKPSFRFLELPEELRNEIYRLLLTGTSRDETRYPLILLACRHVRDEAASILHETADIVVHLHSATLFGKGYEIFGNVSFPAWPLSLRKARLVRFRFSTCTQNVNAETFFLTLCQFLGHGDRVIRQIQIHTIADGLGLRPALSSIDLFPPRLLQREGFTLTFDGVRVSLRGAIEDPAGGGSCDALSLHEARVHVIRMCRRFYTFADTEARIRVYPLGLWSRSPWDVLIATLALVKAQPTDDDIPLYDNGIIQTGWGWHHQIARWRDINHWPSAAEATEVRLLHHAFLEFETHHNAEAREMSEAEDRERREAEARERREAEARERREAEARERREAEARKKRAGDARHGTPSQGGEDAVSNVSASTTQPDESVAQS